MTKDVVYYIGLKDAEGKTHHGLMMSIDEDPTYGEVLLFDARLRMLTTDTNNQYGHLVNFRNEDAFTVQRVNQVRSRFFGDHSDLLPVITADVKAIRMHVKKER